MKITHMHDTQTFGLALFWNGPDTNPLAPAFLRKHSIALILGAWILEITW